MNTYFYTKTQQRFFSSTWIDWLDFIDKHLEFSLNPTLIKI